MQAGYILNKNHQAIKIRCMKVIYKIKLTKRSKYGACKLFIKQNLPSDQNTVHPSYLLNKTRQAIKIRCMQVIYKTKLKSDQNSVQASYLLNKTHQAIKIRCMQVIY